MRAVRPAVALRELRGELPGCVGGGGERGVERLDRDERVGEPVPDRLELRHRAAELHALERVLAGEVEHGAARPGDLVGERRVEPTAVAVDAALVGRGGRRRASASMPTR